MMPPTSLKIKQLHYQEMVTHLLGQYPLEACGLLAGSAGEVTRVYPIHNILQSPIAYEMEPKQQLRAMLDMEAQGWEMLAIYHSHPQGPETPSPTDVARAYYPDAIQLIVSFQDLNHPLMRAFTIVDGRIDEVPWSME